MKKYVKKILAFTLAFIMVFTSGISGKTANLYAGVNRQNEAVSTEETAEENVYTEDSQEPPDVAEEDASDETATQEEVTQETSEENADRKEAGSEQTATRTEYTFEDQNVKVTATLSRADAVPDQAKLAVTEVTKKTKGYDYEAYLEALGNADKNRNASYNDENTLLYDIAFISNDSKGRRIEVEPAAGTVKVDIEFKADQLKTELGAKSPAQVSVRHLPLKKELRDKYALTKNATSLSAEDIDVENVKAPKVRLGGEEKVSFTTGDFSVYAFSVIKKNIAVAEEKKEAPEFIYEDDKIKVEAVPTEADAVPENAKLVVTPVTKKTEGYNYEAYMKALNEEKADEGEKYTSENTLLYDIAFMANKTDDQGNEIPGAMEEIQPQSGKVKIKVNFKKDQLSEKLGADSEDAVQLIHLPLKEKALTGCDSTAEATNIKASDVQVEDVDASVSVGKTESTEFVADTFSVWAWNNGAQSTITIPEIEGTFGPGAPQYEINGTFGELANFGVVGFSEIVQNDHLHSNFATKNYVLDSAAGFGMRESKNGVTNTHKEIYYIGESITGNQGSTNMEIHVPNTLLVLGHDLGQSGELTISANDTVYDISVGGKNIHITSGAPAATQQGGSYEATSIRQEPAGSHYVDLDAMKEKAEALSKKLSDRTASQVTVTPEESNVLIVEREAATLGCMNFNASDFEGKTLKIDESGVNDRTHLLIINIDAAGADSITLPQLELSNVGDQVYNGEVVKWTDGNVVVNVIDSTDPDGLYKGTVKTAAGLFQASILAPDAELIVDASVNGQVFADRVVLNMELHRDSITFTNEIPSVGGLRVAKTMNGSSNINGNYNFKLEGLNYNGHQAPMPGGSTDNTKTMPAEADGLVTFGFIDFDENEFNAGVRDYRYKVSEVIPGEAQDIGDGYKLSGDVAYDANEYIIEVHTKRSSSGGIGIRGYTVYKADGTTVIAEMTYDEGKSGVVTFDNKTLDNESKVVLKAKKAFNSDEWPENGFTFKLEKVGYDNGDGNIQTADHIMPPFNWQMDPSNPYNYYKSEQTVTSTNKTVSFPELTLQNEGTYYYTIREIVDGAGPNDETFVKDGITYDVSKHQVKITVKTVNGKKISTVKYDGKNSLTIANSVKEQTGKLVITKSIDGYNVTEEELNGGITFIVKTPDGKYLDADGNVVEEETSITLGSFTKGEDGLYTLTFDKVAPGKYTVEENNSEVPGYHLTNESSTSGETTLAADDE
ncbi:MAG: hypothetical protein IJH71_11565, partial [Eubacterium sp.]|nr:hypothetical protein [Eubacterium sp.]